MSNVQEDIKKAIKENLPSMVGNELLHELQELSILRQDKIVLKERVQELSEKLSTITDENLILQGEIRNKDEVELEALDNKFQAERLKIERRMLDAHHSEMFQLVNAVFKRDLTTPAFSATLHQSEIYNNDGSTSPGTVTGGAELTSVDPDDPPQQPY